MTSDLMSILNFTEQDLIHNRRGLLSPEQQQHLRQRIYWRIFRRLVASLLVLVIVYIIMRDNMRTLSDIVIPLAIMTIFMMVMVVRALSWLPAINEGKVIIATGVVHLTDETNTDLHNDIGNDGCISFIFAVIFGFLLIVLWRLLFPALILTINTRRFRLKRRVYDAFTSDQHYQLYCLDDEIIAAELLKA